MASPVKRPKHCEPAGSLQEGQSFSDALISIENSLARELLALDLAEKVTHVYNPLDYAAVPHKNFLEKFATGPKTVLFLGMNPGPFGMAQNGIPFGDTAMVKEWMGVDGTVGSPSKEHPKRKVTGLDCSRREVSGTRFWSLWKDLCVTPDLFFRSCYVHNFCPLCFMAASGKNVTPCAMGAVHRRRIERLCDSSLLEVLRLLEPAVVVGVGRYAEECARRALAGGGPYSNEGAGLEAVQVCCMPHPSPANPKTRLDWAGQAKEALSRHSVLKYILPPPPMPILPPLVLPPSPSLLPLSLPTQLLPSSLPTQLLPSSLPCKPEPLSQPESSGTDETWKACMD